MTNEATKLPDEDRAALDAWNAGRYSTTLIEPTPEFWQRIRSVFLAGKRAYLSQAPAAEAPTCVYRSGCTTPAYCAAQQRCTAKDAAPSPAPAAEPTPRTWKEIDDDHWRRCAEAESAAPAPADGLVAAQKWLATGQASGSELDAVCRALIALAERIPPREPTEAMARAGALTMTLDVADEELQWAREAWKAMYDAAIAQTKEGAP